MFVKENVRRAIESHLLDSSPAVRDAAVELIGKYVVEFPHLAGNYYEQIAERIAVRTALVVSIVQLIRATGYRSGSEEARHQATEIRLHSHRR